jgi:hypothetical protein
MCMVSKIISDFLLKINSYFQMAYSYTKMKNQLLSDTIPVTDRDSNQRDIRQRSLTRPRVRTED